MKVIQNRGRKMRNARFPCLEFEYYKHLSLSYISYKKCDVDQYSWRNILILRVYKLFIDNFIFCLIEENKDKYKINISIC